MKPIQYLMIKTPFFKKKKDFKNFQSKILKIDQKNYNRKKSKNCP